MKVLDLKFDSFYFTPWHKGFKKALKAFSISIKYKHNGEITTLVLNHKVDYKTDGASVPKIFRWIVKRWYKQPIKNIPAIVHDDIFIFGGDALDRCIMSFNDANELYYALRIFCKSGNKAKSKIAYKAVDSCIGKRCYTNTNKHDKYNYNKVTWEWE